MDKIEDLLESHQEIYKKHWKTIQKSVKIWRFKDMYHFPLFGDENINTIVTDVTKEYTHNIKINAAFGFILRDRTTNVLKFYHPSNNSMMFDTPKQIETSDDTEDLLNDLERVDILEYARSQRPSSTWMVEKIICMRLDIFKLNQ